MILVIDNYDSFVYNLARYFERLGQTTHVVRNDAIDVETAVTLQPDAIVISPGPCTPNEAGCSLSIVERLHEQVPILGICLGHQAIGAALGGRVTGAPDPMHGRISKVYHAGRGVFEGLPSPISACRYHSLIVDEHSLPSHVDVTARTADGVVMAVAHRELPVVGLQFHPESILTEWGYHMLSNFLRIAGIKAAPPPAAETELARKAPAPPLPTTPVTF